MIENSEIFQKKKSQLFNQANILLLRFFLNFSLTNFKEHGSIS
jgi:hypothetical protein